MGTAGFEQPGHEVRDRHRREIEAVLLAVLFGALRDVPLADAIGECRRPLAGRGHGLAVHRVCLSHPILPGCWQVSDGGHGGTARKWGGVRRRT